MKSLLFSSAIINRNRVKFLYGFSEIILEPYYMNKNKNGKKVLYGKVLDSNEIKMFEYEKICNIKILRMDKFSPVIPIIARYN
jgi:hypothetical protein